LVEDEALQKVDEQSTHVKRIEGAQTVMWRQHKVSSSVHIRLTQQA
jgi:hypothetical protein